MSWNIVDTGAAVHVMPAHDKHPHIPRRFCECTPRIEYADPKTGKKHAKPLIVHRDELDRMAEQKDDQTDG
jgi:hypothetical protein